MKPKLLDSTWMRLLIEWCVARRAKHQHMGFDATLALMMDRIADVQITIIPATGHIFPIEDPEVTVDAIHTFVTSN